MTKHKPDFSLQIGGIRYPNVYSFVLGGEALYTIYYIVHKINTFHFRFMCTHLDIHLSSLITT